MSNQAIHDIITMQITEAEKLLCAAVQKAAQSKTQYETHFAEYVLILKKVGELKNSLPNLASEENHATESL